MDGFSLLPESYPRVGGILSPLALRPVLALLGMTRRGLALPGWTLCGRGALPDALSALRAGRQDRRPRKAHSCAAGGDFAPIREAGCLFSRGSGPGDGDD